MRICVICPVFNEEFIVPYFIDHYRDRVDSIYFVDGGSTDKTEEIIRNSQSLTQTRLEFVSIPSEKLNDVELAELRSNFYKDHISKKEQYDFIIVVDSDEFIIGDIRNEFINFYNNEVNLICLESCLMIGKEPLPFFSGVPMTSIVRFGRPDPFWGSKFFAFDSRVEPNFIPGLLRAKPVCQNGIRVNTSSNLKVLHYQMACPAHLAKRAKKVSERLSQVNIDRNFGFHYVAMMNDIERTYNKERSLSKIILPTPQNELPWFRQDLYMQNQSVFSEIFPQNQYKISKADVEGRTVFDIGANLGFFSMLSIELGSGPCYCFEPHPETFKVMEKNLSKYPPAFCVEKAVHGRLKKVLLEGEGGLTKVSGEGDIEALTLEEAVRLYLPEEVKDPVLKMDCEGSEVDILMWSSAEVIRKFKDIYIELHHNMHPVKLATPDTIRAYLEVIGFREEKLNSISIDGTNEAAAVYKFSRI